MEYTTKQLEKMLKSKDCLVRVEAAEQGYGLNRLINDEFYLVRIEVARKGYGLDVLINDENPCVRKAVAEQGYGLDVLINDRHQWVREAVARKGYGLEILINDEFYEIRAIAKEMLEKKETKIKYTEKELEEMLKSEDWLTRLEVAEQGYGLNVLVNDKDLDVRETAKEMLEKSNQQSEEVNLVNHPKHYNQTQFECIDEMIIIFGKEKVIDWCKITAYKYKYRAGFKDDKLQDLAKADWYLAKAEELKND